MLKTLKLFLLTITFALLGAFSAFAGEDSCGHLDFLNETGVSGWCYQNSQPSSPADFTLRIANVLTGETVQEIPATTSLSRPDLESRTGAESTPGFFVSIDWESLGSGLYTASIVSNGKTVGNSLSYHVSGADGQSGLLEGISSVQNLGNFRITGYCSCRSPDTAPAEAAAPVGAGAPAPAPSPPPAAL
ncbi:uncharacterized protein conserved in bacteria [Clostridium sp. CAG:149]|nr:uncharacterized protein conserved in bacteria [Clostridium sp. CAG:149]